MADCNDPRPADRSSRALPNRLPGIARAGAIRSLCLLALLALGAPAMADNGEPPVPPGEDPGGVAVALIDSGVNYTLPHIARRLARDEKGNLTGRDFADDDGRPYDVVPGRNGPVALHHGSSVASILLREAPQARLVPYRFHPSDYASFAKIVAHMAKGPAHIAVMALGGYRERDWRPFRDTAAMHPEILFVLSAGNDGRNIDDEPIYPASFGLANTVVVASTDAFGRLPAESNWGPETVDVSTPGERITTRDHQGAIKQASGSSYAVPRIAALAARLKAAHPGWGTQELKAELLELAAPSPERVKRTRHGWIPNPALAGPEAKRSAAD